MRKLLGAAIMSLMMLLTACGGGKLVTRTFTSSQSITIPAGVTRLEAVTGYGARGQDESSEYVQFYSIKRTIYSTSNNGQTINTLDGGTTYDYGPTPADYCGPVGPYVVNGETRYTQTCYDYTDMSFYDNRPASAGASATAFGRTFPGSTGNVQQIVTKFDNVPVAEGSYNLSIPAGGSITITYYE